MSNNNPMHMLYYITYIGTSNNYWLYDKIFTN